MASIDHPAACRPGAQQRLALIGPKYEDNQINLLLIKIHFTSQDRLPHLLQFLKFSFEERNK